MNRLWGKAFANQKYRIPEGKDISILTKTSWLKSKLTHRTDEKASSYYIDVYPEFFYPKKRSIPLPVLSVLSQAFQEKAPLNEYLGEAAAWWSSVSYQVVEHNKCAPNCPIAHHLGGSLGELKLDFIPTEKFFVKKPLSAMHALGYRHHVKDFLAQLEPNSIWSF